MVIGIMESPHSSYIERIEYLLKLPGIRRKLVRKIISLESGESCSIEIEDNNQKTILKATINNAKF